MYEWAADKAVCFVLFSWERHSKAIKCFDDIFSSIANLTTNGETVFFETYLSFLRAVHSMLTESVNLKKIMAMNLLSVLVTDGISRVSVLFNTQRRRAPHYQQTTQVRNLTSTLANEKYDFFTLSDDCPAAWAEFEGRKGVFIEGQVAPPLSGVQIVISSGGDKPIAEIKVETDSNGKYRLVCWYLSCKRDD